MTSAIQNCITRIRLSARGLRADGYNPEARDMEAVAKAAEKELADKDAVIAAAETVREAWFAISGAETGIEAELGKLDTALDNLGKRAALKESEKE
jgi:hypothetical protein